MDDITNFKSYIQSSSKAIPTKNKREEDRNTKIWISQEKKSLLDEIKSIFHNYLRAMLWFGQKWKKEGTSCNEKACHTTNFSLE